jgi:hypothetical protein
MAGGGCASRRVASRRENQTSAENLFLFFFIFIFILRRLGEADEDEEKEEELRSLRNHPTDCVHRNHPWKRRTQHCWPQIKSRLDGFRAA